MKSVWVLEQGSYSDYRVVGVFSSRENAEKVRDWINAASASDRAELAEWDLDPAVAALNAGHKQWNVAMAYDGTVEKCERDDGEYYRQPNAALTIWERTKAPAYKDNPEIRDLLIGTVWAKDEKHAIKIANEKRGQLNLLGAA